MRLVAFVVVLALAGCARAQLARISETCGYDGRPDFSAVGSTSLVGAKYACMRNSMAERGAIRNNQDYQLYLAKLEYEEAIEQAIAAKRLAPEEARIMYAQQMAALRLAKSQMDQAAEAQNFARSMALIGAGATVLQNNNPAASYAPALPSPPVTANCIRQGAFVNCSAW